MEDKKKMLTVKEFAAKIGVTKVTVYNWIASKRIVAKEEIKGFKKTHLIPETELAKFEKKESI